MNKLVVSWFVVYAICVILTAIFQGGGGIVSTTLTASLSATETGTIHVTSTRGFREGDVVYIEDEQIDTTNMTATTFTGLTRARNRTSAAAHTTIGTPVYSQELGTMNQASGAPVASSEIPGGTISATGFNLKFLVQALPQVVVWNYPFFDGAVDLFTDNPCDGRGGLNDFDGAGNNRGADESLLIIEIGYGKC